jgi:hypothetical protein
VALDVAMSPEADWAAMVADIGPMVCGANTSENVHWPSLPKLTDEQVLFAIWKADVGLTRMVIAPESVAPLLVTVKGTAGLHGPLAIRVESEGWGAGAAGLQDSAATAILIYGEVMPVADEEQKRGRGG